MAEVPTSSHMDEIRETSRQNGIASLYYFSTAILGWNKLQVIPHREMCDFIQQVPPQFPNRKTRKVVLIPRDCYKSTVGSKSLPLHILIQPSFMGIPGREHRMLLCSHASTNAQKQIVSIQAQIERNQMLAWLYPEIIPDLSKTTWTKSNLLFPRDGAYGEDTIEAAGIDSHIVSRHYTIQIKDDLEDRASAEQPTVREQVKNFYKSAEALFVDEQTAYDLLIGTRWGIDDLYSDIQKNESEAYEFLVRPLRWTQADLELDEEIARENKTQKVYVDMAAASHAPDPEATYYFFPELFPEPSIRRIQQKQGDFMFSMLYLNNPRDPSLAEFKETNILRFTYTDEGDIAVPGSDGVNEIVPFDNLYRVLFWDPALTERERKRRSRNAIVVAGFDHRGRMFLLAARAEFKDPTTLFNVFIGFHQRFRVHKAAIEDAGFQRVLKFPLYHAMHQMDYSFPVDEWKPIGDKQARIRTLIPWSERRELLVAYGLTDFMSELRSFPVFPTMDLLDGAAATLGMKQTPKLQRDANRHYHQTNQAEQQRLQTRSKSTGY